ncbi:MAG: NAD-dependent epimerase/dehydratase family protein [Solirubrobacterales bacterium]
MPNAPSSKGRAAGGRQGAGVLVIGCGFIGSHVVTELASQDQPPSVLTRSQPVDEVLRAIAPGGLHVGDAGEAANLEQALDGIGHVAYCAGGLLPADSQRDPERDEFLTLRPLRAVLEALRERPGVRLSYVSSGGTVYGEPETLPVNEAAPTQPVGSYGKLHLVCEEEIERHRSQHGLRARILRCSTVYGEHQLPDRGQGAVVTFLHRVERELPIDLYGGGTTIRDYVYAGDVAKVLVTLLRCDDGPTVLNVGSGEGTSLLDLLRLVESQVGRGAQVSTHPERGFDVHRIVLDTTRLRDLIEFQPTPLPLGIERTQRWLAAAQPAEASARPPLRTT